jgi:hypothetical protein
MKRRELITWLGGVALSSPFLGHAGRAQQTLPVIGFLSSGSPALDDPIVGAFHRPRHNRFRGRPQREPRVSYRNA